MRHSTCVVHALDADPAEVHVAWLDAMRAGDFERAWQQTDRLEFPRRVAERTGTCARGPQHLRWNGAPLAGRRVLVRCEHGLGDTIQFIRFVPRLRELASSVTVLAQPALVPLLSARRFRERAERLDLRAPARA